MRASIFLNLSDFEPRIILKLFLITKGVNIPIFVDVLLHHETKQEFIFCIDKCKVHLKAVLQLRYKKFLCLDEE